MPPILALSLSTILTIWLMRKDIATRGKMSSALFIPWIWLLIFASRPIAEWVNFGGGESEVGGDPLDASIQFILIVAAFRVVSRRGFRLSTLPYLNTALFVLFLYFTISAVWAPYPFVVCKRLVKELGQFLMIMVVLTEIDPIASVKTLASRCGIILFPLSVVLIKYYPAYGRNFSIGGFPMVVGVTTQKNSLGDICAIFGIILVWDLIEAWRKSTARVKWKFLFPRFVVFGIGIWLLIWSESKTSLLAFLIGTAVFLILGSKFTRTVPIFAKSIFLTISAGLFVTYVWTFAVVPLLEVVGRDATFTERTGIWASVLKQDINPLIGCGFYSFWLAKGESVWEDWPGHFKPHSAHCGYLEMYLDGGYIGCVLLGIFLLATCFRIANACTPTSRFAHILFALAMMSLVLNFSEVYFFRLDVSWFFLVFAAIASNPMIMERLSALENIRANPPENLEPPPVVDIELENKFS